MCKNDMVNDHIKNCQADFYVATNGNDNWSGKFAQPLTDGSDGPLKTIEEAKNRVRELKQKVQKTCIKVLIRGGEYLIKDTVIF